MVGAQRGGNAARHVGVAGGLTLRLAARHLRPSPRAERVTGVCEAL